MFKTLNTAEVKKAFINWISQFADISTCSTGIVAGGAVNSFVMQLLNSVHQDVNDVDVFYTYWGDRAYNPMPIRRVLSDIQVDDVYGHFRVGLVSKGAYTVARTTRKDMLNEIVTLFPSNGNIMTDIDRGKRIIEGFDINCCQIAYDLLHHRFIWTPEYEEFIKTMQIKITALFTPWHTAIRLAKKHQDITGSYLNINDELKLASSFVDNCSNILMTTCPSLKEKSGLVEISFGKVYKEKFDGICDVFGERLSLVEEGEGLFTIAHNIDYDIPKNYLTDIHPSAYLQMWRKSFDIMTPKKTRKLSKEAFTISDDHVLLQSKLILSDNFVTHDTIGYLARARKFLSEHAISSVFAHCNDIIEVMDGIKFIKSLEKEYGQHVYGMFEAELGRYNIRSLSDRAEIIEKIKTPLVDDTVPLTTPFYLGDLGKYARQLITTIDLRQEGTSMHHCVGGYANYVAKGHSYIFHINDLNGGESTVEYCCVNNRRSPNIVMYELSIEQNRAFANSEPSEGCKKIAEELCEYLNSIYVPCVFNGSKVHAADDIGF